MSTVRIAGDIGTVIDEIVSDTGVRNSPSFFVGEVIERSLHCVVRGALAVNVENSLGDVSQLTAAGYQTWAEFRIDSFERFWVSAFSDRPSPERRPARPGPLAVSALVFDLTAASQSEISPPVSARTVAPSTYHEAAAAIPAQRAIEPDTGARPTPGAQPSEPVPVAASATSYDALFGNVTVVGNIELAAVRDEAPALDDAAITDADFDTSTAAISAILCKSNHANPPERANCWRCSLPLADGKVVRINRPALGQLIFSNGRTVTIDRTILVGRSPRAERTDSGGIPQLVMVDSPHGDVSRTHARIFIEGWRVLLEDIGSTNGTVITTEAGVSRRIRSGEPAIVTDGSTIDLGDGAVFRAVDVP
jgi:hypothetical protein